jgi:hypothetical protein
MSSFASTHPGAAHDVAGLVRPAPGRVAVAGLVRSAVGSVGIVGAHRLHHPREWVNTVISFADGSRARVYRETRLDDGRAVEPVLLVVGFVLRHVHGAMHAGFRYESWLNTPLFVGFPGFASKLWLAADRNGVYRGVYEWDGADPAAAYVADLGWALGLVCEPRTITAHLVPGVRRDDALLRPHLLEPEGAGSAPWLLPAGLAGR